MYSESECKLKSFYIYVTRRSWVLSYLTTVLKSQTHKWMPLPPVSIMCPTSHRWALANGLFCCQNFYRASNNLEDIQFEDKVEECVNGTIIPCPTTQKDVKCTSDKLSEFKIVFSFPFELVERQNSYMNATQRKAILFPELCSRLQHELGNCDQPCCIFSGDP